MNRQRHVRQLTAVEERPAPPDLQLRFSLHYRHCSPILRQLEMPPADDHRRVDAANVRECSAVLLLERNVACGADPNLLLLDSKELEGERQTDGDSRFVAG